MRKTFILSTSFALTAIFSFWIGKEIGERNCPISNDPIQKMQVAYTKYDGKAEAVYNEWDQDVPLVVKSGSYIQNNIAWDRMRSFDGRYNNSTTSIDKRLFSRYSIVHWDTLKQMSSRAGNNPKYLMIRNGSHVNLGNDSIQTYLYFMNEFGSPLGTTTMMFLDDMQRCPTHCPTQLD